MGRDNCDGFSLLSDARHCFYVWLKECQRPACFVGLEAEEAAYFMRDLCLKV